MKYLYSIFFLFSIGSVLIAQPNPRKLIRQAEAALVAGKYGAAANDYAAAWKKKPKKTEWRYQAGVAYLKAREYQLAVEALAGCTSMAEEYPLVNLYYARALKNTKEYEQAIGAFNAFLGTYEGTDKQKLFRWVKSEIDGCQKAKQMKTVTSTSYSLTAERLGEVVNTDANDFGPAFFTNDILYYSTAAVGSKASILRSQRLTGEWLPAVTPEFPQMPVGHFCHGSLSPDNKRFYFTICKDEKEWQGVEAACDIYVTQYSGSEWSAPVKMRDYIKMDGTTATHPCVVHIDGIEFVYFSTNRIGGKGGMDIWYTYRFLDTDDFDYALPQNAGAAINTLGDEVTPFYDVHEKRLYFSSNGHPSIGGFDIFRAKGEMESWENVEWLEKPFNSSADDYFFVKTPDGKDQYMVSNRSTQEKPSTTDDDIFYLATVSANPEVAGKIYAENESKQLAQVEVSLYELQKSGEMRLLQSRISLDGTYSFDLIPGKQFRIEAFRAGYQTGYYDFDAADESAAGRFSKDFFLSPAEKGATVSNSGPVYSDDAARTGDEAKSNQTVAAGSDSSSPYLKKLPELPSERRRYTPKHKGIYYKVQLSAVIHYNEEDPKLRRVAQFGRVDLEYLLEKGWIRLLLADYFTIQEAQHVMNQCRMLGYPDAFIVKYKDGIRLQ